MPIKIEPCLQRIVRRHDDIGQLLVMWQGRCTKIIDFTEMLPLFYFDQQEGTLLAMEMYPDVEHR